MTAKYEDGPCETKTYKIAPVGNFEERYLAFQDERDEARLKEMSGEAPDSYPDDPELYTIAEIA